MTVKNDRTYSAGQFMCASGAASTLTNRGRFVSAPELPSGQELHDLLLGLKDLVQAGRLDEAAGLDRRRWCRDEDQAERG